MARPKLTTAERLWSHVDTSPGPDSCWPWTASRKPDGYGRFSVGSQRDNTRSTIYSHRHAWELTLGPIPAGLLVCHRCDNPSCCNPGHLFLGTDSDNSRDASSKGRLGQKGIKNHNAKLTEGEVRAIRAELAAGDSQSTVAARHGVSPALIGRIALRKAWSHVL